jgi:hypothetical protein
LVARFTLVPSPYSEGVLRSRAGSKGRRWDEVTFSLLPADLEDAEK